MTPAINSRTGDTFWLVWTKSGPYPPRKTFATLAAAQEAARSMAAKFPDKRWFVVQAVERLWVNEAPDKAAADVEAMEARFRAAEGRL